jgi:glycosyltransferase involved in cell wall biosynthesis
MDKVSVCIPAWNEEKTIQKCLKTVQNQKKCHIDEILVCLNGVTDNTEQILREIQKSELRLKVVFSEKGKAAAWNVLNEHASNNVRIFVDADCFLDEYAAANLLDEIEDYTIVGGTIKFFLENTSLLIKILHYPNISNWQYFEIYGGLYIINYSELSKSMIRYDFEKMPEEIIGEDFWLSLISRKIKVSKRACAYTNPSSINDRIKQKTRWDIGKYQIQNKYPQIYARSNDYRTWNYWERLVEKHDRMGMLKTIISFINMPVRKILIIYINLKAKTRIKKKWNSHNPYEWEKIESNRQSGTKGRCSWLHFNKKTFK